MTWHFDQLENTITPGDDFPEELKQKYANPLTKVVRCKGNKGSYSIAILKGYYDAIKETDKNFYDRMIKPYFSDQKLLQSKDYYDHYHSNERYRDEEGIKSVVEEINKYCKDNFTIINEDNFCIQKKQQQTTIEWQVEDNTLVGTISEPSAAEAVYKELSNKKNNTRPNRRGGNVSVTKKGRNKAYLSMTFDCYMVLKTICPTYFERLPCTLEINENSTSACFGNPGYESDSMDIEEANKLRDEISKKYSDNVSITFNDSSQIVFKSNKMIPRPIEWELVEGAGSESIQPKNANLNANEAKKIKKYYRNGFGKKLTPQSTGAVVFVHEESIVILSGIYYALKYFYPEFFAANVSPHFNVEKPDIFNDDEDQGRFVSKPISVDEQDLENLVNVIKKFACDHLSISTKNGQLKIGTDKVTPKEKPQTYWVVNNEDQIVVTPYDESDYKTLVRKFSNKISGNTPPIWKNENGYLEMDVEFYEAIRYADFPFFREHLYPYFCFNRIDTQRNIITSVGSTHTADEVIKKVKQKINKQTIPMHIDRVNKVLTLNFKRTHSLNKVILWELQSKNLYSGILSGNSDNLRTELVAPFTVLARIDDKIPVSSDKRYRVRMPVAQVLALLHLHGFSIRYVDNFYGKKANYATEKGSTKYVRNAKDEKVWDQVPYDCRTFLNIYNKYFASNSNNNNNNTSNSGEIENTWLWSKPLTRTEAKELTKTIQTLVKDNILVNTTHTLIDKELAFTINICKRPQVLPADEAAKVEAPLTQNEKEELEAIKAQIMNVQINEYEKQQRNQERTTTENPARRRVETPTIEIADDEVNLENNGGNRKRRYGGGSINDQESFDEESFDEEGLSDQEPTKKQRRETEEEVVGMEMDEVNISSTSVNVPSGAPASPSLRGNDYSSANHSPLQSVGLFSTSNTSNTHPAPNEFPNQNTEADNQLQK